MSLKTMPKLSSLTPLELQTLQIHEAVIKKGINSFVEVGNALSAIRDRRLYRSEFPTFEKYCFEKWDLKRTRAYELIEAAGVAANLSEISDIPPKRESHAAPLAQLPVEKQPEAWKAANDKAEAEKRSVTAKDVQKAVEEIKQPEKPKEILKNDIEKKTEPKKEVIQRQEPAFAMQFATMAISQLERIMPKDPDRQKAFDKVVEWIKNNI